MLQEGQALLFIEDPVLPLAGAVGHCPQDDLGDLEPRFAESVDVLVEPVVSITNAVS